MRDKFRSNIWLAGPAALIVALIYVFQGLHADVVPQTAPVDLFKLIPYLLVIILALWGVHVVAVLALGIVANAVLGFVYGSFDWVGWMSSIGAGISGMGELIIVTLLSGGMMEMIRSAGGFDYIIGALSRRIRGRRGAARFIPHRIP
jgi:Na+/H+ antiporter NhaC